MSTGAPRRRSLVAPDGTELSVLDFGGPGRDALAEHAAGFCAQVYAPLAAALGGALRLWSADLRGHGCSGQPLPGGIDWAVFGSDCAATADGLGLSAPIGIGHSVGATALLMAEQQRPGTFGALYCFEPILVAPERRAPPSDEFPLAQQALHRHNSFASRAEALARFASRPPLDVLHPEALAAYVQCGFADHTDGSVRLRCPPQVEAAIYAHGRANTAFDRLGEVACPVVIAFGDQSAVFDAARAASIAARLPNATVDSLAGLGHFGPLEDPSAVAASIDRTLLAP